MFEWRMCISLWQQKHLDLGEDSLEKKKTAVTMFPLLLFPVVLVSDLLASSSGVNLKCHRDTILY